jgi:hypothetical protein
MSARDLAVFIQALKQATSEVPQDYFQLPVAGSETLVYRERVYCYELYHRLRLALPNSFAYSLAGEIDKSGHPLLRTPPLDRSKPDFLVHSPGKMRRNLLAIEVKPGTVKKDPLRKDLRTLVAYLEADYEQAMLLVYGGAYQRWAIKLRSLCRQEERLCRFGERLAVYWHEAPATPAVKKRWDDILAAEVTVRNSQSSITDRRH